MALLKYGAYVAGGGIWLNGLIAQIDSTAAAGKYLILSALMAAIAFL